jgi:hypothetical protein
MTGAATLVPRTHIHAVRSALSEALGQARLRRPGVPDRDLAGEVAWAPIVACAKR